MLRIEKIDTYGGHRDAIYTLCPFFEKHKNESVFFSAGAEGQVIRWDTQKPDIGELIARVPHAVYALNFDIQTNELWLGENFEGIHVIDPTNKTETRSLKLTNAAIFDIQFHENQTFVASGDGVISVIDKANFVFKKHIKTNEKSVRCLAINPVEREFAAGYSDNTIGIFDLNDFSLKKILKGHHNSVFTLKYSPDFQHLLSAGRDAHLKVWNVLKHYTLEKDIAAHLYTINDIAYSPENKLFATCSMDKTIKIWEAESFKLIKVIDQARYASHNTSINKIIWLKNEEDSQSHRLVSCSDDRTISIWDLHH